MEHAPILIAPLDWGLGHVTRCIPIIETLDQAGYPVILAGSGTSGILLKNHFPTLTYLECPGEVFTYVEKGQNRSMGNLQQARKLIRQIKSERLWINEIVQQHKIGLIISDNRYGLSHPSIPSIFITHQINVISGFGKLANWLVQTVLKKHINQFHLCWIPDVAGEQNLSGDLSHPAKLNIPIEYIGWLSRVEQNSNTFSNSELLILLSGPEPARTALEIQIVHELKNYSGNVNFVRGLPAEKSIPYENASVQFYNTTTQTQLSQLIQSASLVICRSGYSSVMDMVKLNKKAVFIPTPLQPEQVYLAKHLAQQKVAPFIPQENFTLQKATAVSKNFDYALPLFSSATKKILQSIQLLRKRFTAQQP